MSTNQSLTSSVSRRQFINTAALVTAGAAVASRSAFGAAAPAAAPAANSANATAGINYARALVEAYGRPNSKFNGVQVGTITYSFRSMPTSAEEVLKYCVISGISAIEMMGEVAQSYLAGPAAGGGRGGRGGLPNATPAQNDAFAAMTTALAPLTTALQTAQTNLATASLKNPAGSEAIRAASEEVGKAQAALAQARADQLAKIQNSANKLNAEQVAAVGQANGVPAPARGGGGRGAAGAPAERTPPAAWMTPENLVKLADLKRMFNEAGVSIYALKNVNGNQSDAALDYVLQMAKALGATHNTLELSEDSAVLERLGAFGVKNGIRIGYHTHLQGRIDAFDNALKLSPANSLNVDTGHYWAANGSSAIPLLSRFPDRVASIHLKDRTGPNNGQQNLMWGTGETDIIAILRKIRDEKWNFPASAELEYTIPPGSNAVVEVGRCRAYAAMALVT